MPAKKKGAAFLFNNLNEITKITNPAHFPHERKKNKGTAAAITLICFSASYATRRNKAHPRKQQSQAPCRPLQPRRKRTRLDLADLGP